ncbi:uncharacterized protein LOC129941730 [Eupeodes corollae]|uniref:uncharacterized protein LOC129941730 n=1 Tax=Eupeodes corollae TaxID=290404 RepID=UPI00249015D3|nr:uncharacterized protein LOC129941730 [Eupeodes corollae]
MVKITTQIQMRRMVELMEENEHLAKNYKRGYEKSLGWESVAEILNSLGPPMRKGKEWQKVWFDAKFKVKQKLLFNKKENEATGGGQYKKKTFNDLDEAIIRILSLDLVVNPTGYAAGGSFHFASRSPIAQSTPLKSANVSTANITIATNASSCPVNDMPIEIISGVDDDLTHILGEFEKQENDEELCDEAPRPRPIKKEKENVFETMLKKQTEVQEKLFSKMEETLRDINQKLGENVTSISGIEKHLNECARYERKNFHLREENLKMVKIQMERDVRQRVQSNNLKIKDLEVRKKQLELEERKLVLINYIL